MAGITIGPFSFPAGLLVVIFALVAALAAGNAAAGEQRVRAERLLWLVLAGAMLAARAAFVASYWNAYADAPLQALDIRDGGFSAPAGIAAGVVLAAWLAWRNLAERKALLAGALAGTLAWAAGDALASMAGPGERLPSVALPSLAGANVALDSFSGRPLVVNLWASWCPPCRREMPVLANAQRAHPETAFVFVNQGEAAGEVRRYLEQQGLALDNVLLDADGRVAKATGAPGLPTTLFFDAQGRLVGKRLGELSAATLAERLESLRGKSPASR